MELPGPQTDRLPPFGTGRRVGHDGFSHAGSRRRTDFRLDLLPSVAVLHVHRRVNPRGSQGINPPNVEPSGGLAWVTVFIQRSKKVGSVSTDSIAVGGSTS